MLLQEMTKFSNGVQRVNELTRQARDYSRTQQSIRRSRRGITGSDCIWQNAKDYLSTVTSMPAQEAPGLYRPMMSMRLSYYPNTCSSSLDDPLSSGDEASIQMSDIPTSLSSEVTIRAPRLRTGVRPTAERGPFPTINLTTTPLNSSLQNALPPVDNHPSVSVAVTTTSLESDATGPSSVPSQPLQTPSQSLSARSQPLSQPVSVLSQPVSTSFQPVSTPSRPFSSSRSYSRPGSSSSASSHPASSEASLNNIPMGPPSHRLVEPPKGSFMSISAKSLANAMNSVPHARARATDVTLQKKKREAYLSGSILQGERRTTMFMTDSPSQASDDHDSILSNDVLPPVHEEIPSSIEHIQIRNSVQPESSQPPLVVSSALSRSRRSIKASQSFTLPENIEVSSSVVPTNPQPEGSHSDVTRVSILVRKDHEIIPETRESSEFRDSLDAASTAALEELFVGDDLEKSISKM